MAEKPNVGEFVCRVREMREKQKAYFRCRSRDTLNEAIAREREVDEMLSDFLREQLELF